MADTSPGTPALRHQGRVLALDGLRGVAIAVVLVGHLTRLRFRNDSIVSQVISPLQNPDLGVQIFFVLSGYLITRILLRERERTGSISLRRFYARRTFRILPAYYCFLLIAAGLVALGVLDASLADLASSVFFVSNYSPASTAPWLEHTWTLAVEEQYYLLWPLLLLKAGTIRASRIAVAVCCLAPVIRVGIYLVVGNASYKHFQNRADALLIGSLLAVLVALRPDIIDEARVRVSRWHLVACAVTTLVLTSYVSDAIGGAWTLSIAWPLNAVAVAILIIRATDSAPNRTKAFLELRPLVALGVISFSLYLWQQLFTLPDSVVPLPIGLPLMVLAAIASYFLVERPFLALKARYSSASSPVCLTAHTRSGSAHLGPPRTAHHGGALERKEPLRGRRTGEGLFVVDQGSTCSRCPPDGGR